MQDPVYLPSHDLHNHTIYCEHAAPDATAANLVARARELGLRWFGFSEHVIFEADSARIARIRQDLIGVDTSGLNLLMGVEIDADPFKLDGTWVSEPEGLDYAILSPHRIPEYGIGHWQFRELNLSAAECERLGGLWLDWYEACVERGGMQILGHPLREPLTIGLLSLSDGRTFDRALRILKRAAEKSIVFELNNGWAIGVDEIGQFEPFLTLVREVKRSGMKFCRGSDSHGVVDIGTCDGIERIARLADLTPDDWLDAAKLAHRRVNI